MRLLVLFVAGCAAQPSWDPPPGCPTATNGAAVVAPGPHATRNLVLVALDGVRWQEVFEGVDPARLDYSESPAHLLPNIYERMVAHGVGLGAPGHGAPMFASGPEFLSLPGYQELLGGRPSACDSNHCAAVTRPTLLDDARAAYAALPDPVAAIASWERIERATSIDNRTIVLSAGRHHGPTRDRLRVDSCAAALLDQAAASSAAPGRVDYRADRYTALLALEYLAVQRPRVLFVGLGDTDEYAHANDYSAHLDALRAADRFIGALFRVLDGAGDYGAETTVILTTDHGRSDDFDDHGSFAPESARVWLLAAGGAVPAGGLVDAVRSYRLANVAPTARALLGLPTGGDPIAELVGRARW